MAEEALRSSLQGSSPPNPGTLCYILSFLFSLFLKTGFLAIRLLSCKS